jgi:O-antigen/teichoic acid export membrane protein
MVSTAIVFTLLLHNKRPIKVRPHWDWHNFMYLFKVGLPIFLLGYLLSISGTLDRLLLIKFEGIKFVGFYAFPLMAYGAFKVIPQSLANYFYPKMSYAFGKESNKNGLISKALKVNIIVFFIMLPIAIIGYFLLPILVPIFFPKYIEGIKATQILLFAGVFSGASIGVNVLWSMKIWKYIYISQVVGALLNVFFIYLGYKLFKDPLIGISMGVLTSQIVYMILNNFLVFLTAKNG